MAMTAARQIAMEFIPGLLEQFPDFMDCVRASVHNCGRPFKAVAADIDMSVSELSRRLAPRGLDDKKDIELPLRLLPSLVKATGDTRPVQWLALAFLADPSTQVDRALRDLAALAPVFMQLAATAGLTDTQQKGRR